MHLLPPGYGVCCRVKARNYAFAGVGNWRLQFALCKVRRRIPWIFMNRS